MSMVFGGKAGKLGSVLVVALLMVGTLSGMSGAQHRKGPCADDVATFCKDVQPGGGRVAHCLKQHEQELTPDCKSKMQQKKTR